MPEEKLKLLLVDDELDICTYVQSYFGKRDFAVSTTGSALEALSMIKTSRPDLVLLDVKLHDMTGIEMVKKLRESDDETKVIIITGTYYSDSEIEYLIHAYKLSGFKDKPLILEDIEKLVYKVLGIQAPVKPVALEVKKSISDEDGRHDLVGSLGVIRGNCEDFILNYNEGLYKDKSSQELVTMSMGVMQHIQETVDKIIGRLKK